MRTVGGFDGNGDSDSGVKCAESIGNGCKSVWEWHGVIWNGME